MIPQTWTDVIPAISEWYGPCVDASAKIRVQALDIPTAGHVGFYYSPEFKKYAVYAHEGVTEDDLERTIKFAKEIGPTRSTPLTLDDLDTQPWVKVAYSQMIKTIAENLNFIPGKYLGMIPNNPNPLAAMLTSGLVGAGLGYGAGRLVKAVAPEGWGENLPTSLALLGGLGGAGAAGLIRAYPSITEGKSLLSNWPFSDTGEPVGQEQGPEGGGPSVFDISRIPQTLHDSQGTARPARPAAGKAQPPRPVPVKRGSDKCAFNTFAPDLPLPQAPTPFDVNVDALGRTLWQTGASPQVAAGTMATMYAASQMPSNREVPGYVMADQLGKLALNAAGDYSKGFMAGYVLNKVVGTPYTAPQFGMGNLALGVIKTVVPTILGQ